MPKRFFSWILGPAFLVPVALSLSIGRSAAQGDDSLARELVKKHVAINSAKLSMPGFRVQIHYGVQRVKASEIKSDFMRDHPGIPSYLVYQQPNFKVRVGDCKTRLEALRLLSELQSDYPAAFVVPDEVKLPDLGGNE
jgi:hypothetical protein